MESVGTVTWQPEGDSQEAFEELTLLVHAMMADREHIQDCGGTAECGTCRVRVVSGGENLTAPTLDERELYEWYPDEFAPDERLACQCRPTGDVTIAVPDPVPEDLRTQGR